MLLLGGAELLDKATDGQSVSTQSWQVEEAKEGALASHCDVEKRGYRSTRSSMKRLTSRPWFRLPHHRVTTPSGAVPSAPDRALL